VKVIADIFVPTAFTPNNDGKNDRWQIAFHDPLLGATVKVYNRYGQLVYQAAGTATDWDGNVAGMQQASGAYVYVIQFNKRSRILKGTLLLIR
jgi:gliding motility-associated-like protein